MEDISQEMAHRPRYWERLITVLAQTIRGKETPGIIIQVRSHSFIYLYNNHPFIAIEMYSCSNELLVWNSTKC